MFFLVPVFCDISPFPGGGGGRDTAVSLQPGGQGRPGGRPQLAAVWVTSRKPSAPGWAPWLGRGFCWKGGSRLLGAACATQGGGLFPERCLGGKHKWPLCVCSQGVGRGAGPRGPARPGWVGALAVRPSLDPSLASVGGRRTSEATDGRLFFM